LGAATTSAISCGRLAKVEQRQKPKDDKMARKKGAKGKVRLTKEKDGSGKKYGLPKPRNQEPGHWHVGKKAENKQNDPQRSWRLELEREAIAYKK